MKNDWDRLVWGAEACPEENEIRISIEGVIDDVDDRLVRKFQENDIRLDQVKLVPVDDADAQRVSPSENAD
ncbi:hypothetical protein [Natrinema sp. 1APR25-10V2]|uniref:hypothetical protein n=1 Tax=Natrinema sp. 1APR25-10V2 TaxID=2951081 RepID=UPI002876BE33|nr:hypothetical protein [Natrinema sp. 1APR25-10V2]MDS0474887.1 hypothetical protein [Natrinema sp. 1APR25-10V2]